MRVAPLEDWRRMRALGEESKLDTFGSHRGAELMAPGEAVLQITPAEESRPGGCD